MKEEYSSDEVDYESDIVAGTAFHNFGIKYLFPWQRMVIANILEAFDIRVDLHGEKNRKQIEFFENEDSYVRGKQIVLLPTGAGKSLCFLVPAVVLPGITMVIYPLLALMTDQYRRMTEGSLQAVMFRGGQTEEERNENFEKLRTGQAKVIIANPEVLQNIALLGKIKELGISHVAIDEAHCVSEWGDSFRPSYLKLGEILTTLNPPVITAFTATASPTVLSRISEILFSGEAHVVRSEADRQNIHYFVRYAAAKKKEALILSQKEDRPLIIFCGTRNRTEEMSRELNACFGSGFSKFYHAGLEKSEKDKIEKWFFDSEDGVLCATCAYGMGVDKKNIHTVIHLDPPQTAEAYIQEAGRGGRDGSVAKAILLWSPEDSLRTSSYPEGSREAALRQFAETKECRRQILLDALGAEKAVCSGCDLCNNRLLVKNGKKIIAQKPDYELAYLLVKRGKHFYTQKSLEEELYARNNRTSVLEIGRKIWTHSDVQEVVQNLEIGGRIKKDRFLWKNCYSVVSSSVSASALDSSGS
ncbi:MAG: RecQ family ATP-dependent DNA helicase [Treponema sp.]|nr:RecQ family ATP-dependent DNA helicase [Treponema sp.]